MINTLRQVRNKKRIEYGKNFANPYRILYSALSGNKPPTPEEVVYITDSLADNTRTEEQFQKGYIENLICDITIEFLNKTDETKLNTFSGKRALRQILWFYLANYNYQEKESHDREYGEFILEKVDKIWHEPKKLRGDMGTKNFGTILNPYDKELLAEYKRTNLIKNKNNPYNQKVLENVINLSQELNIYSYTPLLSPYYDKKLTHYPANLIENNNNQVIQKCIKNYFSRGNSIRGVSSFIREVAFAHHLYKQDEELTAYEYQPYNNTNYSIDLTSEKYLFEIKTIPRHWIQPLKRIKQKFQNKTNHKNIAVYPIINFIQEPSYKNLIKKYKKEKPKQLDAILIPEYQLKNNNIKIINNQIYSHKKKTGLNLANKLKISPKQITIL